MLAVDPGRALGVGAVVPTQQSLGGEDFAWYLESIPGAFARLGTRSPDGMSYDIHQGTFDVDERAIALGVRFMATTALTALWEVVPKNPDLHSAGVTGAF